MVLEIEKRMEDMKTQSKKEGRKKTRKRYIKIENANEIVKHVISIEMI